MELNQGYGLTETTGAATFFVNYEEAKARPSSVGELFPGFSAKVINHETREASPPFKEGELWLKGPGIMKEYFGNEEATSATITKDGWLKTGDLCYFDDKGYLYIVDRIKELIKHNGYQVYLTRTRYQSQIHNLKFTIYTYPVDFLTYIQRLN